MEADSMLADGYPYNLLVALNAQADIEIPSIITRDISADIRYALSTLQAENRRFCNKGITNVKPETKLGCSLVYLLLELSKSKKMRCKK